MIVVMEVDSTEDQIEAVIGRMIDLGFSPSRTTGRNQTLIAGVGQGEIDLASFQEMDGVKEAYRISSPFKLASRVWKREGTEVVLGRARIGGAKVVSLARVCAAGQVPAVIEAGVDGVVVPVTRSRIGYQPPPQQTLAEMRASAAAKGLSVIVEVASPSQAVAAAAHCDGFLVIASQMQNYALLEQLGELHKPVILERSLSANLEDWLLSAEAILTGGNGDVVLCERGIKTFDALAPTAIDITAFPAVHRLSHLPVIADPLRATGRKDRVLPVARAAVAAGADGVILDAATDVAYITGQIHRLAAAMGRESQ